MSHYEFSAGPGIIAQSVLKEAQANLVDFHGAGRSIMEMSHRGAIVTKVANEAEADLRELLNVPDTHAILFAQGGATGQFSAIPLNLCGDDGNVSADFVVTGSWSAKASVEATKYLTANNVVEVKKSTGAYQSIPEQSTWKTSDNATYLHYTDNETVHGVEFVEPPTVAAGVELVVDMSSNFLSRAVDVSKFGVIIAGAQKNCGIAGVTLVIIKKSLLGRHRKDIPIGLQYQQMEKSASMYNTPPVWAIYMAGLVFKWIKSQGGVDAMQKRAVERSSTLYDFIDNSDGFYVAPVAKNARSRMNIVFRIKGGDVELEKAFVAQADAVNLHTLKGHRSVGGLRASLYNAMPMEGVNALIAFMKEFQAKNN